MSVTATVPDSWTLAGTVATARAAGTAARLDIAAPATGLAVGDLGRADHLLGVDLGAATIPPADHWVRGADLTAVYEPDDARRLRATTMWRILPNAVATWDLIVSAQTSLLHADAALAVVSEIAGDDVRWAAADAAGWTPIGGDEGLPAEAAAVLVQRGAIAAVVAAHPQDPRRIEVRRGAGRVRVTCGIFPTVIEKGVILRSRVLGAIGSAADAEAWATSLVKAFAASPPFIDT